MPDHRHCKTCRHGPNPEGRVFTRKRQQGCQRMDGIERVFDTLGDDLKATALQMSAAIVGYLDSQWKGNKGKRKGDKGRGCPGYQPGEHLQGVKSP